MLYCNISDITRSREGISCSEMLERLPKSQAVFSFLIIFALRLPSSCSQYGCFTSTHHSSISERKKKWYWWKGVCVCVCVCWFCTCCKENKEKKMLSRESTQLNSTHSKFCSWWRKEEWTRKGRLQCSFPRWAHVLITELYKCMLF